MRLLGTLVAVALASGAKAGLMSPIVIINTSPTDVVVDMSLGQSCIYTSFNNDQLEWYYRAWQSTDLAHDWVTIGGDGGPLQAQNVVIFRQLDDYLQTFKRRFGIWDMREGLQSSSKISILPGLDAANLDRTPFSVHQVEMRSSAECLGRDSWKRFDLIVGEERQQYELRDPALSAWEVRKINDDGTNQFVVNIGSGGYISIKAVLRLVLEQTIAAVQIVGMFAILKAHFMIRRITSQPDWDGGYQWNLLNRLIEKSMLGVPIRYGTILLGLSQTNPGNKNLDPTITWRDDDPVTRQLGLPDAGVISDNGTLSLALLDFDAIYRDISVSDRNACLSRKKGIDGTACRVAGTSLLIQPDGTVLLLPLPGIETMPDALQRVWG
ncbi:uncharacterized protein AB675_3697 [Cyphellophora attinorum]|uniref:Uncharacterized protein n=1 Tax=Cyphellophora attinorum TaxID=1664694 RepID=A0A0N1H5L6_9EURO|nr:uncharacterized protein AB675_3697 [Phialophora attinorum]KPI37092.1 hypothetical protein AB675_3697 [Phialophora attinorum]